MKKTLVISCLTIFILISSFSFGFVGAYFGNRVALNNSIFRDYNVIGVEVVREESAIIDVVDKAAPSVVSIVITKDVPLYENLSDPYSFFGSRREQVGTEERQVGAGTGFIISEDGLAVTNRHVVQDTTASYTAIFSDGTKKTVEVLSRDTILDIAFVQIEGDGYTPLNFGSSEDLKVGQSVIAIGNALGEFSNTVSSGIISGLQRDIVATDSSGRSPERLTGVIQTDASINSGNSGGPLLDIRGNVIGVNVAVAGSAENIGFAIPVDLVKDLVERLNEDGTIERPILGVRILHINDTIQERNNLKVNYGAIVRRNSEDDLAVIPGSPADKAGLRENDIVLEVDGNKVTEDNPLPYVIQNYKINDVVTLKLLRQGNEIEIEVKLEKF